MYTIVSIKKDYVYYIVFTFPNNKIKNCIRERYK